MKLRRVLIRSLLVVALLVGGCGLAWWLTKRQYALNRQLIAALIRRDNKEALGLVNAGADPNTRSNPPPTPTLPLLLHQWLHRSPVLVNNSPTAFQLACGAGWHPPNTDNWLEYTSPEDMPLVRAMLAHGADSTAKGGSEQSALHYAVIANNRNTAQLLLEQGVNVNAQDSAGTTPLTNAVINENKDMMRLLLDYGANVSIEDKEGNTALYDAVRYRVDETILRLLLTHGADPNRQNKDGDTPLKFAQLFDSPHLLALLHKSAK